MSNKLIEQFRYYLKDNVRLTIDFSRTDQHSGVPPPPVEKPFPPDRKRIDLKQKNNWRSIGKVDLISAMENRRSHRVFTEERLTLEELSFLLWATQGIRKKVDEATAYRTVPSAGCRHALETYLCVLNIDELEQGIYRYLPLEHQLLFESGKELLAEQIVDAALGQPITGDAAVTFIWTAIPYRMEWRYDLAAHKVIALDAGHVCQNLYLACEAIGAGTCAIGAYHQELVDRLLGIDGKDEFTIYLASVGKIQV
ncbi:MAG: SagB/ThcOx family dehydrogenase [Nitrospiraceae bacterium]|nr:MAG: SagB/ThcOx family dehydrogenase [Nitrospiraceae bacterium]